MIISVNEVIIIVNKDLMIQITYPLFHRGQFR